MSRILTGDSQKLSFSTVTIVRLLIFRSDKPPRRTNYAHIACGGVAQPVHGLGRSCPALIKSTFLKFS